VRRSKRLNDFIRGELIGMYVIVQNHADPTLKGVEGIVTWETKNFLYIKKGNKIIKVPKQGSLLVFKLPNGNYVKVLGDKLINRPEDRLKQV